jgi:hypothetical protein
LLPIAPETRGMGMHQGWPPGRAVRKKHSRKLYRGFHRQARQGEEAKDWLVNDFGGL